MVIVVLVLAGLIMGSFVNALAWRYHKQDMRREAALEAELTGAAQPKRYKGTKKGSKATVASKKSVSEATEPTAGELSMLKGRSMCSRCHHPLAAKDLVPLFSWLSLGGRCRYCRKPIEDSPLVELLLPVAFAVSYLAWPRPLGGEHLYLLIFWLVFLVGFAALTVYDLRWFLLPDRIVWPLNGLALVMLAGQLIWFHGGTSLALSALWGVLLISGLFWLLYQLSGGSWIGGGDIKLGIALGVLVGGPLAAMLLLFIASLAGTLLALPLMALGKAGRRTALPFGPFLILAAFVVVVYHQALVNLYQHLFRIS